MLLKDRQLSGLFFRLVALNAEGTAGRLVWEHEIPFDFEYRQDADFFHSFESDGGVQIGFLFGDEREADDFAQVVQQKSEILQVSPGQKSSREGSIKSASSSERLGGSGGSGGGFFSSLFRRRDRSSTKEAGDEGSKTGKSRRGDSLTAEDIGDPTDFQHLSHIGFNAATGSFDVQNIPAEWQAIFKKAGVTNEQLQSADTAGFIADFVKKNVDRVPAAGHGTSSGGGRPKGPPPPPPAKSSLRGPPPPPPARQRAPPPPMLPRSSPAPEEESPAPAGPSTGVAAMPMDPGRAQLLASIRGAGTAVLRPVERSNSTHSLGSDGSGSLAEASTAPSSDIMASMLAKALAARNKKLAHSDSEEDANASEW